MSVKIKHFRIFAATAQKSILLKFCPDVAYYVCKCLLCLLCLQCQSQSLLNAMVLASLTTFHTPTIDGIRVWQEYNTGEARCVKCNEFNLPRKISTSQIMKVTEDNTSPKATFTKMKARGPAAEHLSRKSRAEKANSSPEETKLFQCPNYGYVKSFQ